MANSKQIVYLSQTQYAELIANGSITADGVTVTYNEDDIYMTPQAEPITDVRIAGASVTTNGIAEIPIATSTTAGAFKTNDPTFYITNGNIRIDRPSDNYIRGGTDVTRVPTIAQQHKVVFYGLAKAAGDTSQAAYDGSISNTEPGNYTPEAKGAIQSMLGTNTMIAPDENDLVADRDYAIGDLFTANGKVYKVTSEILTGATIVTTGNNANCEETSVADAFVKDVQANGVSVLQDGVANIPIMSAQNYGVAKAAGYGIDMGVSGLTGYLVTHPAESSFIKSADNSNYSTYRPIVPRNQHESTFYGLAKAAGDTTQSASSNAVGTYTDEAKAAIKSMIGVNVDDVQVNGTSIVSGGMAEILIASNNNLGVVKTGALGVEVRTSDGVIYVNQATETDIKNGNNNYRPLCPTRQHQSVFYGLAKAAGDTTQSTSSNAVGTYTDSAKSAIRNMIGAANAEDIVAVQDTQPTSNDNKIWLPETVPEGVEVPTVAEMNAALAGKVDDVQVNGGSIVQNGVANVPIARTNVLGIVQSDLQHGIEIASNGKLWTIPASDAHVKAASDAYRIISPYIQHKSVFYGLAKAAGDTTQSQSDNPVGQYTDSAKAAIKTMLGIEEGSSSGEVVTPIDDTAGVGDTAKVWSADKTSTEINNIIDTAPTEELAADLLMQEETNTYLNEKFLSSIHNMFESLPQDEILSEILDGLVDGNSLLRQLYHELEARKLAAE